MAAIQTFRQLTYVCVCVCILDSLQFYSFSLSHSYSKHKYGDLKASDYLCFLYCSSNAGITDVFPHLASYRGLGDNT